MQPFSLVQCLFNLFHHRNVGLFAQPGDGRQTGGEHGNAATTSMWLPALELPVAGETLADGYCTTNSSGNATQWGEYLHLISGKDFY